MKNIIVLSVCLGLILVLGCADDSVVAPELQRGAEQTLNDQDLAAGKAQVDRAELFAFLPAGDVGGGVLTPGTFFPPTKGGTSTLLRHAGWVQYNIHTTGLPQGAYTVWIVTINDPESCATRPCSDVDIFFNPAVDATVFWSDGGIVQANGVGNFRARVHKGVLPDGDGQIGLPGSGLMDPFGAEIHLIVKYHGLASDDQEVLYEQTHTLLGSCDVDANALDLGAPFGVHCFDPQAVVHMP